MSNNDSFIDEVTDEVRRDRLFALMRKYGWIGILGVVGVVAGAGWTEWKSVTFRDRAQAFGDAVLAAMEKPTPEERATALGAITPEGGQAAALALLTAASQDQAGDTAGAVAKLQAVAADATLPDSWRQLARLKAVMLGGATLDAAARKAELEALAAPGAPFRVLALEQLALLQLEAGDRGAAIDGLKALLQEPDLTPGLRSRATQVIVALGGTPEA